MLEKDEKIIKLTRELRELERKFQDLNKLTNGSSHATHQRSISPFAADTTVHNRTISSYSPIPTHQPHLS